MRMFRARRASNSGSASGSVKVCGSHQRLTAARMSSVGSTPTAAKTSSSVALR